jgi:hypothetical protein
MLAAVKLAFITHNMTAILYTVLPG